MSWSSTFGIGAVIMKGGQAGANVYTYTPPALGDSGLETPINPSGQNADLSHISFCYDAVTQQYGALDVTKTVNWNGEPVNQAQTFEICITGPSYATPNCKTADYDGGTLSWADLIPGDYTVTETSPGATWNVTGSGVTIGVAVGQTATTTITNTAIPQYGSLRARRTTGYVTPTRPRRSRSSMARPTPRPTARSPTTMAGR